MSLPTSMTTSRLLILSLLTVSGAVVSATAASVYAAGDTARRIPPDARVAGRVDPLSPANPLIFLGNGVTSTFPAGEVDPEGMMAARRRIERGEQIGPRILSSGPYFGSARPGWKAADDTASSV